MRQLNSNFLSKASAPAIAVLFALGCGREDISVYRIPKETNQVVAARPQAGGMAGPHSGMASKPEIHWTELPAGWKSRELAAGSMRAASFTAEASDGQQVEIAVTPFVGATDIESGSLNMWRGELGLPQVEGSTADSGGQKVPVGAEVGSLYEFSGSKQGQKARIVGAIVKRPGVTWFFKMSGSDAPVLEQKAAFGKFLSSISFVEGAGTMMAAPNASTIQTPAGAGGPPQPKWDAPAHWQLQPGKTMVVASYAVSGDGGKAEVAISAFPGDVGGLTANLTRWRRQMGLGPATEADVAKLTSPLDVNGTSATFVDMVNEATGTRLTAVILPHAGMSWFFKLTGPDAVVTKEKAGFIKFVQSVKFPTNA
ncbi:MAG: hypothetical protein EXS31_15300 [Pedosphaera sp.]|nr:hypothetical protein [Pedosphaera sp.]